MAKKRVRRGSNNSPVEQDLDLGKILAGFKRTETKRGRNWFVQPMSAVQAQKVYQCPGCNLSIAEGIAHLVIWSADDIFGEEAAVSERRHWHNHCWRIS